MTSPLLDPAAVGAGPGWLDRRDSDCGSCVYLLLWRAEIVYVGQTQELSVRIGWHRSQSPFRFDRVRVLPLPDDKRTRLLVERHVRELAGVGTESVRDRIEMNRPGLEVNAEALAGTGPIRGVEVLLRWLLS